MEPYPGSGHGLQAALLGAQPAGIDDAPWRNVLRYPADDASVPVAKTQAGGTAEIGGQQGANASTVAQTAPDAAGLANNGAAGLNATAAASYGVAQSTANTGAITMGSPVPVASIGGIATAKSRPRGKSWGRGLSR